MTTKLTREAYERLVNQDIAVISVHAGSHRLEVRHAIDIMRDHVKLTYEVVPDLLHALAMLHDDIAGRIEDGAEFNPGTLVALEAARKAVAKARGRW